MACGYCNRHKGPNIAAIDRETGQMVALYNPRHDLWSNHFLWKGAVIVGRTPTGRATEELLGINDWQRIELRENLQALGEPFVG